MSSKSSSRKTPFKYNLNETGDFIIENYNYSTKMASFLPGIADTLGIPMWVFYVNRGQGVSSFGIDGKDSAMVEFFSANRSYQLTPSTGFRTFYRIDGEKFSEPFQRNIDFDSSKIQQRMITNSYELKLEEINKVSGIQTNVNYFTIPNEPVGALARVVTIKNIKRKPIKLEVLDGLPQIVCNGLVHFLLKDLTNLTEAWVQVENAKDNNPFYKLKIAVSDKPQVEMLHQGNFYFSRTLDNKSDFSPIIIDPTTVFDSVESFQHPDRFLKNKRFEIPKIQRNRNIFPCGFSFNKYSLKPSEEISFVTLTGNARTYDYMRAFKRKCNSNAYIEKKMNENREAVKRVEDNVMTFSSDKKFDAYCRQTFLDNVLRGGIPYSIKTDKDPVVFHIYSRRHGDLERDYNRFQLMPTYFSQGNGNYRDVNQNRRNDIRFNPDSGESTIRTFMNLIQLDGYNPLVIKGSHFWIGNEAKASSIVKEYTNDKSDKLKKFLLDNFTPGDLFIFIEEEKISLKVSRDEFLSKVLEISKRMEDAEHGEGFWSDHWTYNLDLIESYISVFPEREHELLFEEKDFTFYENSVSVKPRSEKYFLTKKGVRQFNSVLHDTVKDKRLKRRKINPNACRTKYGKGSIYTTTLFVKLISLMLNKSATLDPYGMGIEMEADKPGWYDALNSLPGLFGSSISETYELKRLVLFLKEIIKKEKISDTANISIPKEIASFLNSMTTVLSNKKSGDFAYWDRSHTIKENYREKTIDGIDGEEVNISIKKFKTFFDLLLSRLSKGISKARSRKYKVPLTYFSYEVTDYKIIDKTTPKSLVKPKKFKLVTLPLFLEGPVHAMRSETDKEKVRTMHRNVTRSPIFDKKLKMYKVNASLEEMGYGIGRTKTFPAGWLENESVWLHMQYKYILELLKKGLFDEFFRIKKNVLIPYMDAHVYGRSILENSSFLVSSAYYDESMHGRGFVARLSGSTAEMTHIWLVMVSGANPFILDKKGNVVLSLSPALPGELFTRRSNEVKYFNQSGREHIMTIPKNAFAFKFLGSIPVTYKNPKRLDTWKAGITSISVETKPGTWVKIKGNTITGQLCQDIRSRNVCSIEAVIGK
ncbi:MAG: hypothetical protein KAI43_04415 [Candidatus Aureabacteria bacterium]|nr:hypothetical protein [Candidatus Auribacterota bacterium]